jgi:histidinol-phosphatase
VGKKIKIMDIRNEIPARDIERYYSKAMDFSTSARRLIQSMLAAGFEIKRKPDNSFVTTADLRVEEFLRELIRKAYPDHGVIGEEYPASNPEAAFQWIMDPIDGTEDFIQRLPTFGSILALYYRGEPIVGVIDHPVLDWRVSAAFGMGAYHNGERIKLADLDPSAIDGSERIVIPARANFIKYSDDGHLFDKLVRMHPNHRVFRTCFAHTCSAIGATDATIDYGTAIWDVAANRILMEEAGGKFSMIRTWDVPSFGQVTASIMGKPQLVNQLMKYFPEN